MVFKGKFIYYVKARKNIYKGCIYHVVYVRDVKSDVPTFDSISIVRKFPDVFLDEFSCIPPQNKINFSIDLLPDTQLIFITLYRMTLIELNKMTEQLMKLFDKGFIMPNVSLSGASIFFVRKKG